VTESTRVVSVSVVDEMDESMVSEAMRGEDRVRRPACEWCGDMPGRRSGELGSESQLGGRARQVGLVRQKKYGVMKEVIIEA
jgi:hypothetical protein